MGALLHFGNMKFKQKQREEQAEPDGTEGSRGKRAGAGKASGAGCSPIKRKQSSQSRVSHTVSKSGTFQQFLRSEVDNNRESGRKPEV